MVWARTRVIGCGRVKYYAKPMFVDILFCNYGPAGNSENEKVYEAIYYDEDVKY